MHDHSFNEDTIGREIKPLHFKRFQIFKNPPLRTDPQKIKEILISDALKRAEAGFQSPLKIKVVSIAGKSVYELSDPADDLVMRKSSNNIRFLTKVKQQNRDTIIEQLICLLREGVPYRLYRLDIREFFESLKTDEIVLALEQNPLFPRRTVHLIHSLLQEFKNNGAQGVPRGLPLSATLSEFALKEFDSYVSGHKEVFFYSRFVDDIVIITSSFEDAKRFYNDLVINLPRGLRFNKGKEEVIAIDGLEKESKGSCEFTYLGYQFKVLPTTSINRYELKKTERSIEVDIATQKIKKMKSRIIHAAKSYVQNRDFRLLNDRIKFLSGNYSAYDRDSGKSRNSGIYFNYRHVNKLQGDCALVSLDKFFKNLFLSKNGDLSISLNKNLLPKEKRWLLRHSFVSGFSRRTFFHHLSWNKFRRIRECWINV